MGVNYRSLPKHHLVSKLSNMSIKIVDILKACKHNRMEQALGLREARNRYGGVERTANMTSPWASSNVSSSPSYPSSITSGVATTSESQFIWNSSNAARYEEGTTFYSQVKQAS